MTSEDLLARTSHYHFHESSPPPSPPSTSPSVDGFYGNTRSSIISTGPAVDSPMRAANENRPPSRRGEHSTSRAIPPPISNPRVSQREDGRPVVREPIPENLIINPRNGSSPSLNFTVTTDCEDRSGDEEEESSPAVLADDYNRDLLPSSYSSSEDDEHDAADRWSSNRPPTAGAQTGIRLSRRRATPSRIVYVAPEDEEADDALEAHASFFIERRKSMVSIKFDPPV